LFSNYNIAISLTTLNFEYRKVANGRHLAGFEALSEADGEIKFKSGATIMAKVIDYLAEEQTPRRTIIVKETTKARKAHRSERVSKLLSELLTAQPKPVVDFLARE